MSDFLNFTDEIIDGTPKYTIIANGDGTNNIELANDIVQEGTFLNKANFNRLNRVLGYEKITGVYNPITQIANYDYPFFTSEDLTNNLRILVQGANNPTAPATNFSIEKEYTTIGTGAFAIIRKIEMSNGNIMAVASDSANLSITILDKMGNVLNQQKNVQPI